MIKVADILYAVQVVICYIGHEGIIMTLNKFL